MQRMTVTPQLRAYVLNLIENALIQPETIGIFGSVPQSAIERAKSTPDGRQTVRQLEHHASAYELDDLALIVEVFGDVLKARKLKNAKKRERDDAKRLQKRIASELRAEAKKVAKHQADLAQRKADREAAKKANETKEAA